MSFWISLLLFFLLVRYILPVVLRAALGGFVRQQVRKAQQGYPGQADFFGHTNVPPTTSGQVKVDYVPPTRPTERRAADFKGGEYIEYEEVP
ncbi:MAG: hypothetical protein EOO56_10995 [Hymenobacter sp.]|nr:MAG: hypothetical protein EOO56_10995 [Hymenobacter sp.]